MGVAEFDRDTAARSGGGYPDEDENPFRVDIKEALRLQLGGAAQGPLSDQRTNSSTPRRIGASGYKSDRSISQSGATS